MFDQTKGEEMPIILGCTELPLIIDKLQLDGPYIDTTTVLAKACVELGMKKKRSDFDGSMNIA